MVYAPILKYMKVVIVFVAQSAISDPCFPHLKKQGCTVLAINTEVELKVRGKKLTGSRMGTAAWGGNLHNKDTRPATSWLIKGGK